MPEHFRCLVWIPLLKRAGLWDRKPHTLRHTFASMLIQAGESLAHGKEQLGYSSITITEGAYGRIIPGMKKPSWIVWTPPPDGTPAPPRWLGRSAA
jgi:integrase